MYVWTTLEQAQQIAQGVLDVVSDQNYLKSADFEAKLQESSEISNIETELSNKVSAEVIGNDTLKLS